MFDSIKQLVVLATRSRKIWLVPIVLFLVIIALAVVGAQASPLPLFLYPFI